jgi:Na+-transporting methylmalonyl-CoA/oxaloacetate decarboxylase gamma subunit
MIEQLQKADIMSQGLFVAAAGLIGVFLVLVLFFITIRLIEKFGSRGKKD